MKIKLLSLFIVLSTGVYAQKLISYYNFYSNSMSNQWPINGYTCSSISTSNSNTAASSLIIGANTLYNIQEPSPMSKALRVLSGNPGAFVKFNITGSALPSSFAYRIYFQTMNSGTGATTLTLSFSKDDINYIPVSSSAISSTTQEYLFDLSTVSALNNINSTDKIYFKIEFSGTTGGTGETIFDNLMVECSQLSNLIGNTNIGGYEWSVNGNNVPSGSSRAYTIGTITNSSFSLKTNNIDRINFLATGAIGVGKSNPSVNYKLDVGGSINATDFLKNGVSLVSSQWVTNGTKIGYTAGNVGIGNTNPNTLYKLDVTGALNATTLYQNGLAVVSSQWTSNGTKIGYTAGSVGIGTTNPNAIYKLDVAGTINSTGLFVNGNTVVSSQWVTNGTNLNYTTGGVSIGTSTLSAGNKLSVLGNTDINGNVSIGKSSATSKLEIKGNAADDVAFRIYNSSDTENFKVKSNGFVYAREVQVHPDGTAFPDYVFETNYSLMNLKDLENYIKSNKHLPNIPSANQVSVSGFGVAEMQIKQMEKIEELTLYIIEQNKKLATLEEEIKVLKNKQSK
jgi:hypothetical protein